MPRQRRRAARPRASSRPSAAARVITATAAARLGLRTAIISGLSARRPRGLRADHVRVVNLKRAPEPHAITVALSTTRDRSFVTFNGVNDRLQPRLPAAVARQAARHIHFAFAPRRLPALDPHRRAPARAGRDDVVGLRMESAAARQRAIRAASSAASTSSSSTRPEAALYARTRRRRFGDRVLAARRAQHDHQAGPARQPVDRRRPRT